MARDIKTSRPNGQLLKSTEIFFFKKEPQVGDGGLALYPVVWLAMCLFKIAGFEVDTLLKWMPWLSKLKSDIYIKKGKKLSGLTLHIALHSLLHTTTYS